MTVDSMFFNNWADVLRTVLVGVLAYAGLITLLRISGKRTLSKMNAFDLIVTVALGSTLATILLSKEVALAEGLVAFAVLILLQYIIAWLQVRSNLVEGMVKAEATLLLFRGQFIKSSLKKERVTESEVRAAMRESGIADPQHALAVVLETDGTFSAIPMPNGGGTGNLQGMKTGEEIAHK
jgi:uncharacterized membrane protein YcaP (DUF421 family)